MIKIGTSLLTKDGRKCGNATVIKHNPVAGQICTHRLLTDAGNIANFTEREICEQFYIANYPIIKPTEKILQLIIRLIKIYEQLLQRG